MDDKGQCGCAAGHNGHLCMLRSKGLHDEITRLTGNPKFYCFTCGSEANCAENLCSPAKIE